VKKRLAMFFFCSSMEPEMSIRQNITAWVVGWATRTWLL